MFPKTPNPGNLYLRRVIFTLWTLNFEISKIVLYFLRYCCFNAKIPYRSTGFSPASFLSTQVGAVGGIRTLEPLSGYTISSRARYDHFDTTAHIPLFASGKQHYVL